MVFPSEEITVNEETSVYDDDLRSPAASSGQLEKDRKQRREIANSNERRRMQSINAGFQTLRSLLPASTASAGGSSSSAEKLSKATILQQASAHIKKLDDEKRHLAARNEELQRALALATTVKAAAVSSQHRPQPQEMQLAMLQASAAKRKKRDTECSDEGIAMAYSAQPGCSDEAPSPPTTTTSGAESAAELRRELSDLRASLDAERQRSGALEHRCGLLQERLHGSSLHAAAGAASVAAAAAVMPLLGLRYPAATGHECCLAEPAPASVDLRQTSMSRRNLQMIVEAIHHLEGGGDIEGGAAVASPAGVTASPSSSVEDTGSSCNSRDCGGGTASAPAEAAQLACSSGGAGSAIAAAAASGLQQQLQQHLYYRPTFMAQLPCALEGSALVSRR